MTILRKFACGFAAAAGMLGVSSSAFAQGAPLFAVLNGGNECNNAKTPQCRQGELKGFGSATLIFPTPNQVCFGIVVDNLAAPTAAHFHSGVSGINGPIVVALAPPSEPSAGNPGASSGCVAGVAAATIAAIRADPTEFYVNVHTKVFPNGAVRGQLF